VVSSALSLWRLGGPVLGVRLIALLAMGIGLLVVGTQPVLPVVPLGVVAVALLVIVVAEMTRPPDAATQAGHATIPVRADG
jgi:hypothetical protein